MPRVKADGVELFYESLGEGTGSELVILRDSYHAAHRENAPAWNAAVQAFLRRHELW